MSSCVPSESTVPISDMVVDVLMFAPEAPDVIIENALRRKAVEFSNLTRNLTCEVRISTQENVGGYPIELPKGLNPKGVRDVVVCGECYRSTTECERRRGYQVDPDVAWIEIFPPVHVSEFEGITLNVDYVLDMEGACNIPRSYFNEYANTIVAGALSLILAMPEQKWTNRTQANENARKFSDGVSEARDDEIARKFGNGGMQIQTNSLIL